MIKINGTPIEVNYFPDGTLRLNIEQPVEQQLIDIIWLYEQNEEMLLYYIVQHFREDGERYDIYLTLPYIPNARMDRVKNESEVFTLKHFCKFINSLNFENVFVRDAHSSVALALIDRVIPQDKGLFLSINSLTDTLLNKDKDIVFYPDEGSVKRYSGQVKFPYAFGIKNRDWDTGKILGLNVQGNIPSNSFDVLIVDDISSYGGTFLHSARKLKELGADKIYLYVTHCENSILKGELINSGLLNKIYTTRSIFIGEHPLIQIID